MFYLRTEKVKINRKQNKKKNADIKIVIAQVRNPDVSKVAVSIKFHFKAPDSERENGQMSVNKWHQRWRKKLFLYLSVITERNGAVSKPLSNYRVKSISNYVCKMKDGSEHENMVTPSIQFQGI